MQSCFSLFGILCFCASVGSSFIFFFTGHKGKSSAMELNARSAVLKPYLNRYIWMSFENLCRPDDQISSVLGSCWLSSELVHLAQSTYFRCTQWSEYGRDITGDSVLFSVPLALQFWKHYTDHMLKFPLWRMLGLKCRLSKTVLVAQLAALCHFIKMWCSLCCVSSRLFCSTLITLFVILISQYQSCCILYSGHSNFNGRNCKINDVTVEEGNDALEINN